MSDPSFIPELQRFLRGRLADRTEGSYSLELMTDHLLAQRKLMEEAFEVCLEVQADEIDRRALAEESADVVFHLLALLTGAGLDWADVEAALRERHEPPARKTPRPGRVTHIVGTTAVTGTPVPDEPDDTDDAEPDEPPRPDDVGRVSFTVGTTTISGIPVPDEADDPDESGTSDGASE